MDHVYIYLSKLLLKTIIVTVCTWEGWILDNSMSLFKRILYKDLDEDKMLIDFVNCVFNKYENYITILNDLGPVSQ